MSEWIILQFYLDRSEPRTAKSIDLIYQVIGIRLREGVAHKLRQQWGGGGRRKI